MPPTSSEITQDLNVYEIENTRYYVATKQTLIEPLDLHALLSNSPLFPKMYWHFRGKQQQRAMFGKVLHFTSPPKIKYIDNLMGPISPVRFYGGEAFTQTPHTDSLFSTFPRRFFFLPRCEVIQNKDETCFVQRLIFKKSPIQVNFPPLTITKLKDQFQELNCHQWDHQPNFYQWMHSLERLIAQMQKGPLEKIVLARTTSFQMKSLVDPFLFLRHLITDFKNSTFFCLQIKPLQAFLGASPEVLYTRDQQQLYTEALAGTCSEKELSTLFQNSKIVDEFEHVTLFFNNRLKNIADQITALPHQERSTGYVKHLHCPYHANLKHNIYHEDIIKALFPSSALCGTPQKLAYDQILQTEPLDRGWYAAPMGWLSQDQAEFIVSIRSCLISDQTLHLLVGNGITKDSDPQTEWQELNLKMRPFFKALGYESI